jgi:hypothetical protein
LFAEPSPAPIKHWLWRSGLIDSAEVRLPMTEVSMELAARIDLEIERRLSGHCEARSDDEAVPASSLRDGALAVRSATCVVNAP